MDQMHELILSYPRLAERLALNPENRKKVFKIIDEIHGDFNPNVIKALQKTLDFTLMKLYDGINLEQPPGFDLKELAANNCVILVPNHQSHADYVAITYALFKEYQIPIHVAGGINLNIFLIGEILRKAGCFFIRRTFSSDILYRLTLEAYLFFLLSQGKIIEFYFEGGRSRTGKLLPPRFGLFQMLIESHSVLDPNQKKPLVFVPISIVHEYMPEEKSHIKELEGGTKKQENVSQLFKIYSLMDKRLGTIHIKLGDAIPMRVIENDVKSTAQEIAFDCFRAVGRGMLVTPTSLLAMILLDEFSGILTLKDIYHRATAILEFCRSYNIPLSHKLSEENFESALKSALERTIRNKKVSVVKREKLSQVFYSINNESRLSLLYFKNTIVHHFLVPYIIHSAWVAMYNGSIQDEKGLTKFLLERRNRLKFEFYLPTVKELVNFALKIVSDSVGRPIESLSSCLNIETQDLHKIRTKLGFFARACHYIDEGYYLGLLTLKHLEKEKFTKEQFLKISKEIFELEKNHGRLIKYEESYSVPLLSNTLKYFKHKQVLEFADGRYLINEPKKLEQAIEVFSKDLAESLTINMKFNQD